LTPYFEAPGITLYCGNSADFQHLEGQAVITDPPYGTRTYETDLPFSPALLAGWVARYPSVAVMGYPELVVSWCLQAQVCPDEWVTWWPTNKPGARCLRVPRSTEHIAVFGATPGAKLIRRPRSESGIAILNQEEKIREKSHIKIQEVAGKSTREWAQEGDVWRDAAPGMMFNSRLRLHPNEKPVSLGHKLVTLCTNPGDTVIDYYAGSGAFLVAAVDLGRKSIGVELDEKNCETIAKRFQQGRIL
jgi:DNA modification methylase